MRADRLRALALAEWRGYHEPPVPRDRTHGLGEAVTKVMQGLGLKERLKEEEVVRAWQAVVGEFVARHSSPLRLKDGVLIVQVLQPTLRFDLERVWKAEILARLKERFGARTVREIRFRIG
jgi:predicted nucleic acid-binding Zn ribbon protein